MKLVKKIVEQILIDIINRSEMPQIKGDSIPDALKIFNDYGVPYEQVSVKTEELLPIQDDYIPEKVKNIISTIEKGNRINPIFISNDNYIVDGHHRWLAYKKADLPFITCIKIGYPKMAALKLFDKIGDKIMDDENKIVDDENEELNEKYLTSGKIFTAVRDLDDYDIIKGDRVKITGTELSDGYFGIKNLKNNEEFRIYSLVFIKNFR